MHENGLLGLMKDDGHAVELYALACSGTGGLGSSVGCGDLIRMYESERGGLMKNDARAMAIIKPACDRIPSRCADLKRVPAR
jgi:TPR repeat protein